MSHVMLIYHSGNEVQLYGAHFDNMYRKLAWNTYCNILNLVMVETYSEHCQPFSIFDVHF